MSSLYNRVKSWVTGDDFEDDIYNIDEEFEPERPMTTHKPSHYNEETLMERPSVRRHQPKSLKVVDHPATSAAQVIVIEPKTFEESLDIVEHLRAKKSVILNLHLLDTPQSQRVVDFLSGATHAIDGNQQRIGDGVFIFTPNNISITTEQSKEMDFSADAFWKTAH